MFPGRGLYWRRRAWRRWRRPLGCWWLFSGLFGVVVLLALARLAYRLF